jgi:pimeloyl-ACP methyl ester carboxylesterase
VTTVPDIRYAKTDDGLRIAYQSIGTGPPDVIYASSFMGNIAVSWDYSRAVRFYERMARFCRLVIFDRRGTGLSDPMVGSFTMDDRTSDITAVMDAVGLERAVLLGSSEGATAALYVAAMQPERVQALVLFAPAVLPHGTEGSWTLEATELFMAALDTAWETGSGVELVNPSIASDPDARDWYGRYFRLSASPSLVRTLMRHNMEVDIRGVLPSITAPTLLLMRRDETWILPAHARFAASAIPGARLVELPGTDHYIWEQNADDVVDEIAEFLVGTRPVSEPARALRTVLFTDIVGSTGRAQQLGDAQWRGVLDRYDDVAGRQVARFGGRVVKSTGDGALATFDAPTAGIRAALAVREAVRALGVEVRAGVHTGEIEQRGDDIGGIAVHIAARVASAAGASEVLVSRTVADLVAGSDLTLVDRGEHDLKGLDERWRLFAVDL